MNYKITIIVAILLLIYLVRNRENVSNRDYVGEVLTTGRTEIPINKIKYSGMPVSFKLSDNKISSNS